MPPLCWMNWSSGTFRSILGTRDLYRSPETQMNPPLMTTFVESVRLVVVLLWLEVGRRDTLPQRLLIGEE
jgi:hypothetical protein